LEIKTQYLYLSVIIMYKMQTRLQFCRLISIDVNGQRAGEDIETQYVYEWTALMAFVGCLPREAKSNIYLYSTSMVAVEISAGTCC